MRIEVKRDVITVFAVLISVILDRCCRYKVVVVAADVLKCLIRAVILVYEILFCRNTECKAPVKPVAKMFTKAFPYSKRRAFIQPELFN